MHILFLNYVSNGPPFNSGIAALSAYLKRAGHDTSLLTVTDGTTVESYSKKLIESAPDLVAVSVHTPHWTSISPYLTATKATQDVLTVCGGYHPTLCPEEVISHPDVDLICRGEGEQPLLALADALAEGRSYSDIPGLWVKHKGASDAPEVVKNEVAPLNDLDELPHWDRELFIQSGLAIEEFSLSHIGGMPISTGRGCPFQCSFCNNSSLFRLYRESRRGHNRYVRKRSVRDVIDECKDLIARYNVNGFEFWDEMFALSSAWIEEFSEIYKHEVARPFGCAMRVEAADYETLKALKEAGCRAAFFGVETGNEAYRKKYLNRNMQNRVIEAAFENAKQLGIQRFAWVMFGLPDETPDLIEETLDFIRKIEPDIVGWSVFDPLPGTALADYCQENGYLSKNRHIRPYLGAPHYEVRLLDQPSLTPDQLTSFCDRFRDLDKYGILSNK